MTRRPRIALMTPPTQSFFMPYSAPSLLASFAQRYCRADTRVIDGGLEWLLAEAAHREPSMLEGTGVITRLRERAGYKDVLALRTLFADAESAMLQLCEPFSPERVDIIGRYHPPVDFHTWADAGRYAQDFEHEELFDRYFERALLPALRLFQPDVIGLSLPFDWMLYPAMRLLGWLDAALPESATVIGGHAVNRLWNEGQVGFFENLPTGWVAITDGEAALASLLDPHAGLSRGSPRSSGTANPAAARPSTTAASPGFTARCRRHLTCLRM